jgi:hypothetical protein
MREEVVHVRSKFPGTAYIGRPSPYGNPFVIGKDGTRQEVIEKHRAWLLGQPDLVRRIKEDLAGKTLACFCAPLPCHGDTLAELANGELR